MSRARQRAVFWFINKLLSEEHWRTTFGNVLVRRSAISCSGLRRDRKENGVGTELARLRSKTESGASEGGVRHGILRTSRYKLKRRRTVTLAYRSGSRTMVQSSSPAAGRKTIRRLSGKYGQ